MSGAETEFVARMGLVMERLGGSQTMGRVYAWLLICAPPAQSLTDLATVLDVSKASVSTVARQLLAAGMLQRVPAPGRQHRYQVTAHGWTEFLRAQAAAMRLGVEALDFGLSVVSSDLPQQRARLQETRAFFAFGEFDANHLARRWEAHRRLEHA
jgi:DNA-binding transcriptional regulator GbsR (MarR family)